ncbi:Uncharacterised protein [uncultured archaeon]|nr:Uncharacterised protein [uncultured archaeon]
MKDAFNNKIEATGNKLAGFSEAAAPAPHLERYAKRDIVIDPANKFMTQITSCTYV